MRAAIPALVTLLNSGVFVKADLWTFTFSGGLVARWTSADVPVLLNGNTFVPLPLIDRGSIVDKTGLEVSTLDLTVVSGAETTVNGVPFMTFASRRGLDGAVVKLERAFLPDWNSTATGAVLRFAGRVTSIGEIGGASAKITVSSWAILLNVQMPPDLYQAGCLLTVYGSRCLLNRASFSATSAAASGSTASSINSSMSSSVGYLDQGSLTFTSGQNSGVSRTVKRNPGGGVISMTSPFPYVPAVGDTFSVVPGCDHTLGTCSAKFNNAIHFKGTPFVPVPETAV